MRTLWKTLALLLLAAAALASTRGREASLRLFTDFSELEAGERYSIHLESQARGYVYLYSLDPRGTVRLLYPLREEDGRGEVEAGQSFSVEPVIAGRLPGRETLVAVHTREYRRIKASRHEFLAPDPEDLEDIHYRLTRRDKELDDYASWTLSIDGPPQLEESTEEESLRPGILVHSVHYDYFCGYCDCWHPTCNLNHCWCDHRVLHYYHGHYHYGHCFGWGARHWWWQPPVVYVYIDGGSRWDYDTREYREKPVWRRHRHYSREWREEQLPEAGGLLATWRGTDRPRVEYEAPELRKALREMRADKPAAPRGKRTWTTRPSIGSRGYSDTPELRPSSPDAKGTSPPATRKPSVTRERAKPTPQPPSLAPAPKKEPPKKAEPRKSRKKPAVQQDSDKKKR